MIKILKEGNLPKNKKIIYRKDCNNCGCQFEFELEDCLSIERCLDGKITIQCPCCKQLITANRNSLGYREEDL